MQPSHGRSRPTNLPVELTTFVGRREELGEVRRALASTRLLTLVGPGGVGKTRVGLRIAREAARQHPDGVWFVDLASVTDPQHVTQTTFVALGLQDHSARWSLSTLTEYLSARRALLVFDNCEHVLDAAATVAGAILRACPDVQVLATSREALGVTGERVVELPPLSMPDAGDESAATLLRSDSVALFVERAAASRAGFELDARNGAAVLALCQRLDGIPLALELAAVRLHALGLDQLADGLADRLAVLGTGDRSAAPRQQTLEATIDWSYRLLDPLERLLWARLSVFAGGFGLDAAQSVCVDDDLRAGDVPRLLAELVEKSVLRREVLDGVERYRLLETLRQFGQERLRESGAEADLRRRHLDWIGELATVAGANDQRQVDAFRRVRLERANLWSALDFCRGDAAVSERGVAICGDLWIYWSAQGPISDVRRILAALAARLPSPRQARGQILWVSAMMAAQQGDHAVAVQLATESLAIGRSIGDAAIVAWGLQALSVVDWRDRNWDEAIAHASESLALARTMGLRFAELGALETIASARTFRGEIDEGIAIARDGIALSEELGESWQRAYLLRILALAALRKGEADEAELLARRCVELKRDIGDLAGIASVVEVLASIAVARGTSERAATLLGGAEAVWQSIPSTIIEPLRAAHDAAQAETRAALGTTRFEAARRTGLAMTRDEVTDYALDLQPMGRQPMPRHAPAPRMPLSRREMEVARLVADGATNGQAAADLFISERTVESHVASIFNKLGLDSRLQVARWVASFDETAQA